jgi:hypothetical protein
VGSNHLFSSLLFSFMLILFMPSLFIHWVRTFKQCGQNHGLKQNGPKSLVTQLMAFSKIPTISFFCSIHPFIPSLFLNISSIHPFVLSFHSFTHPSIHTTILFFWLIHSFISFFPPFIHSFHNFLLLVYSFLHFHSFLHSFIHSKVTRCYQ